MCTWSEGDENVRFVNCNYATAARTTTAAAAAVGDLLELMEVLKDNGACASSSMCVCAAAEIFIVMVMILIFVGTNGGN